MPAWRRLKAHRPSIEQVRSIYPSSILVCSSSCNISPYLYKLLVHHLQISHMQRCIIKSKPAPAAVPTPPAAPERAPVAKPQAAAAAQGKPTAAPKAGTRGGAAAPALNANKGGIRTVQQHEPVKVEVSRPADALRSRWVLPWKAEPGCHSSTALSGHMQQVHSRQCLQSHIRASSSSMPPLHA